MQRGQWIKWRTAEAEIFKKFAVVDDVGNVRMVEPSGSFTGAMIPYLAKIISIDKENADLLILMRESMRSSWIKIQRASSDLATLREETEMMTEKDLFILRLQNQELVNAMEEHYEEKSFRSWSGRKEDLGD